VAAAGQDRLVACDAAPCVDAGENDAVADELLADHRIHAVAGDHDIRRNRWQHLARARRLEEKARAVLVLLGADAKPVRHDAVPPDAVLYSAIECEMQTAAMDTDFRILITCGLAARLLVDELPEPVKEAALGVLDTGAQQLIAKPERGKFAHRMRQQ